MAHKQHGSVVVIQNFLQQIERFDIQVIGWLVEHQQIALPRHEFRQQKPRLFPARKCLHRPPRLTFFKQKFFKVSNNMAWHSAYHDLVGLA